MTGRPGEEEMGMFSLERLWYSGQIIKSFF